jgi:hypothetical protein
MREHAHQLLDRIEEPKLATVVHLLESLLEEDPDRLTPEEARLVAEADEMSKTHSLVSHEEVLAEFGLTNADWEGMSREP